MTDRLPWSDRFEVGVAALDRDHRRMVAEINGFCAAVADGEPLGGLRARVDALIALASGYLTQEAEVLDRIRAQRAGGGRRINEHAARLASLYAVRQRLGRAASSPVELEDLCIALIDWFVQQAINFNSEIRAFYLEP